jgi:chemotaxis protein CheC
VERRQERVVAGHGEISDATLRKLRVLSELSMGRAGESLTSLLGHRVRLTVADLATLPIGSLPGLVTMAGADPMAGLTFQVTGETAGQMVILLPQRTIFRMLRLLLGTQEEPRPLAPQERSAVQEVGNILASSFLSGLGDLLEKPLMPTPPEIYVDDVPGLMRRVRAGLPHQVSEVLVVQALLEDPEKRIEGRFFFLPEMASLEALLHGAGSGSDTGADERLGA